ncbi:MAG: polyprenyl synthetase family protein [Lachnospiraceae bacterium]|jgi:geranylgeranyl diphosphate synthase type II|nr:polyprenyl synthetase family protein [Lachnospiraceae bacterium]
MNKEFCEELAARTKQVEAVIEKYLPKAEGHQKTVVEAMNYSVQAGGKRLRPMLMLETYRMFGGRSEVIEPFMAAMEMIHTYSLVHDDLPAMDNDEYRRGKKTTHAQFGEAMGILAGDGLLGYAFETAAKAFELEPANNQIGKALSVLAQKSGIYGMLGGQCVDVQAEGKTVSEELLRFIYQLKTGALLEASMMIGAILAGATLSEQKQVEQAAGELGLAFQIQDDLLDVTSTTEELGKPVGSDEKNHKTTWVTLFGVEEAKQEVERLSRLSVERMDALVVKNEFLTSLMLELIHRKK